MPRVSRGTRHNKATKPASLPADGIYRPSAVAELDQRSKLSRELNAHATAIVSDLGHPPSTIESDLLDRYLFSVGILTAIESSVARLRSNGAQDLDPIATAKLLADLTTKWTSVTTSMLKLASVLGIKRAGQVEDVWADLDSNPTPAPVAPASQTAEATT